MIFLESHSKHFLKSHRTHSLEWGLWITWDMLLHIYLKSVAETQTRALVQFRALSFNDAFLRRLHGVRRCGASRQPDLRDRVLAPMWYGLRRAQTHQVKGRSGETLLVSTLQMKRLTLKNPINGPLGISPLLSVFAKMLHRMNSLVWMLQRYCV